MTVAELIAALSKFPEHLDVTVEEKIRDGAGNIAVRAYPRLKYLEQEDESSMLVLVSRL